MLRVQLILCGSDPGAAGRFCRGLAGTGFGELAAA
jgi:hypothetical protein